MLQPSPFSSSQLYYYFIIIDAWIILLKQDISWILNRSLKSVFIFFNELLSKKQKKMQMQNSMHKFNTNFYIFFYRLFDVCLKGCVSVQCVSICMNIESLIVWYLLLFRKKEVNFKVWYSSISISPRNIIWMPNSLLKRVFFLMNILLLVISKLL